jgi:hypothetical protein
MQKFKIMQIVMTDAEVDAINEGIDVPRYNVWKDAMTYGGNALKSVYDGLVEGYYEHVATITADNVDDAYMISNVGHKEDQIERHTEMHSLSVGDIIVTEEGEQILVDTFGFCTVC